VGEGLHRVANKTWETTSPEVRNKFGGTPGVQPNISGGTCLLFQTEGYTGNRSHPNKINRREKVGMYRSEVKP